jgi:hypothetical protein
MIDSENRFSAATAGDVSVAGADQTWKFITRTIVAKAAMIAK